MWKDVESMWNVMDSIVGVCGIHVVMWNPCGSMWNPWGNVWNGTIPPGIHLECGGRVNYCGIEVFIYYRSTYICQEICVNL